jgi:hypothetical protein
MTTRKSINTNLKRKKPNIVYTRKYFCVPLWLMIDSFILLLIDTTNNLVIDYLLLIYNPRRFLIS